jgi:excisionase family DNA binding protein
MGESMSYQPDEIVTIDGVAAYPKAEVHTVFRLVSSGKMLAFKLGGTWRFLRSGLDQWFASQIGEATDWVDDARAK